MDTRSLDYSSHGFRVWGFWLWVWGLRGLGLRVEDLGVRVWGFKALGFRLWDCGSPGSGLGCRVVDSIGFGIKGVRFRV